MAELKPLADESLQNALAAIDNLWTTVEHTARDGAAPENC
jgi:hypothetical protein